MLSIILTWVGAVLGIAVLIVMAFGAFVVDFDDARDVRRKRDRDPAGPRPTTGAPTNSCSSS
jgi:hypothetical protein